MNNNNMDVWGYCCFKYALRFHSCVSTIRSVCYSMQGSILKSFWPSRMFSHNKSKTQRLTDKSPPSQLWKPGHASKWSRPNSTIAGLGDGIIPHSLLQRCSLDQPTRHFCYRSNEMLLCAEKWFPTPLQIPNSLHRASLHSSSSCCTGPTNRGHKNRAWGLFPWRLSERW